MTESSLLWQTSVKYSKVQVKQSSWLKNRQETYFFITVTIEYKTKTEATFVAYTQKNKPVELMMFNLTWLQWSGVTNGVTISAVVTVGLWMENLDMVFIICVAVGKYLRQTWQETNNILKRRWTLRWMKLYIKCVNEWKSQARNFI